MPAPSVLPGRAFQNTARKSNLLFHFRSSDLLLKTVGGLAATFSRAGAPGRVIQKGLRRTDLTTDADLIRLSDDGTAQTPCWGYFLRSDTGLYEPVLVLGRPYTNLISTDNLAAWTATGTPVISAASDPMGGAGAYTLEDDNAALDESIYLATTFTGDGVKSYVAAVRNNTMPGGGQTQRVGVLDQTAGDWRGLLDISAWVSGNPTVSAVYGTLLGKRYIGNGYWGLWASTTSVTAANVHRADIYAATGTTTTGKIDVYRVNVYNDAVPPPFIVSATIARVADSLTFPYLAKPQAATYLYEGIVCDLPNNTVDRYLFNVGSATGATAHIGAFYDGAAARVYLTHGNGSAEVTGYWSNTVALGDYIAIRVYISSAGAITAGLKVNSAAEDTTLDSAVSTQALPTAWAAENVRFSGPTAAATCNSGLISFKAAAGSRSLAWMQEAY